MKSKSELININGGASKSVNYGFFGVIAGVITFVIGMINGFQNPVKCNG